MKNTIGEKIQDFALDNIAFLPITLTKNSPKSIRVLGAIIWVFWFFVIWPVWLFLLALGLVIEVFEEV